MGVTWWLALRGLRAHPLSLAVCVVAVAIGVGFQVPNTANLAGSSATLLEEELVLGAGDVRVEPRDRPRFAAAEQMAERVRGVAGALRVVPVVVLPGGIVASGSRFISAPVVGVDFAGAPLRIAIGRAPARGDLGVVLGSALARRLSAHVGDSIEVRIVLDDAGSDLADGGAYTMTVRGIAGNSAAYQSVFVDRDFLAGELEDPGSATTLLVHLPDHNTAKAVAATIEQQIPGVRAIDWASDDPFLPTILRANRTIERVSYVMVVAAITIPLLALFYIRARRARRDTAVLRALGFTGRAVFAIYVLQAVAIAIVGSAIGAAIAVGALAVFDHYPIFTWETMVVRPRWTPETFCIPIVAALAASVLAGALAAWYAARTQPARVLQQLD